VKFLKFILFFPLMSALLFASTEPTSKHILESANAITTQVVPTSAQFSHMQHILLSSGSSTFEIQSAINTCSKQGGVVELQEGNYLSGPLHLKSGVYLQLDANAVLTSLPYTSYPNSTMPQNFITAENAHTFGIIGTGCIDGNGAAWWQAFKSAPHQATFKRPRLIYFQNCHDIYIANITLKNSPSFHIVPLQCKNVVVSNVTIATDTPSPNTDGIDPASTTSMVIENCHISDGDDNIAIKAQKGPSKYIYIIHNHFGLGHGLSIGAQTNSGVSNIYALNNSFSGTTTGIRIKSPLGSVGSVKNLYYINTTMNGVGTAFELSAYYPENTIPKAGTSLATASGASLIARDIYISHLTATQVSKNAMLIVGSPQNPFTRILLQNVAISSAQGAIIRNATLTATQVNIIPQSGPAYILQEGGKVKQTKNQG